MQQLKLFCKAFLFVIAIGVTIALIYVLTIASGVILLFCLAYFLVREANRPPLFSDSEKKNL